jgi:tRNA-splicing ligase RtcB
MKKIKISNKDIKQLGFSNPDVIISLSREANKILKRKMLSKADIITALEDMIKSQDSLRWKNHPLKELNKLIMNYLPEMPSTTSNTSNEKPEQVTFLRKEALPYPIFGKEQIESGALAQMDRAMSLPVSLAGALMPDAHEGYGLPIGGVLATQENVVIPYAVGVDIACRMCMSIYALLPKQIDERRHKLRDLIDYHTIFGVGSKNKNHLDTSIFDKSEWSSTRFIKQHRDLAYSQLGTSGAGNHFVEWGELTILVDVPEVNLKKGEWLALLSHSGSRGFGNEVASYYSKVAMSKIQLPKEARHLAWLDLSSEDGHEYWIAMNLAGDYASANHREIHQKIAKGFGLEPKSTIENHHNFAWKEKLPNGKTAIIHRKGATPAGKGVIGIIPGSMTHPGYIVRGKGNPYSLNSASHGAGRLMSRAQALKQFTWDDVHYMLQKHGVELIGGDIDEIPSAYKDIETVMKFQEDMVEVLAIFKPRIVKMADAERGRRK